MKTNIGSILFSAAIVIAAFTFAYAFQHRNKANNSISVTGLGSKDFISDLIVWSGSFSKKNISLKEAYSELDRDRENVKKYLIGKGISDNNIVFSSVSIEKEIDETYDNYGRRLTSTFTGYRLRQNIQLESNEVDKVEEVSREVSELINLGVEFESFSPQYYYTRLAELKIEMIAEATKDANIRAQKIAENAGSRVGKLKKADMGVFQIVAQNSAEEYSWGGSFNTTSKRKTATITVKLDYEVN
ncbi:MAG: SIMPL domain-containing protein [Bacteroidales bacterium]|nr:SIMPL domain-containing protein [Bacteroidales bacterium]